MKLQSICNPNQIYVHFIYELLLAVDKVSFHIFNVNINVMFGLKINWKSYLLFMAANHLFHTLSTHTDFFFFWNDGHFKIFNGKSIKMKMFLVKIYISWFCRTFYCCHLYSTHPADTFYHAYSRPTILPSKNIYFNISISLLDISFKVCVCVCVLIVLERTTFYHYNHPFRDEVWRMRNQCKKQIFNFLSN